MISDLSLVLRWWAVWVLLGGVGWLISQKIFSKWEDRGYAMAKIWGAASVSWLVWVAGTLKVAPFSETTIWVGVGILTILGIYLFKKGDKNIPWKIILLEEGLFLVGLIVWTYVKGHEPMINGLEKFMDFGFTKSIMDAKYFPPQDIWFAGGNINYYYFGHLIMAMVTKLSGIDLGVTFNLMLCTIFTLTLTMTWAIMRKLLGSLPNKWRVLGATLTMVLMVLAGNLQTIYAFTKGYSGDSPPPFWTIWSNLSDKNEFKSGWNSYWYPNATRFIPYTIHEFPAYSFVVSDVHGHVLDLPIALLCIGLLLNMFLEKEKEDWWKFGVYGMAVGFAFTTNALDGLIYLGLWVWIKLVNKELFSKKSFIQMAIIGGVFLVSVSPFVAHFKSFVSGLGVDCPPASMTNKKIGPFLFETPDKCQKSPLWMWLLLWGFFWYCGTALALSKDNKDNKTKGILLSWTVFCLGLTIFPEFFYFKDIYPMHFRSNTMFKLGYQAYILMMLVSGYTITTWLHNKWNWQKVLFIAGVSPLLVLISIYPLFSLKSYFGILTPENYKGMRGLSWISEKYPSSWETIKWLQANNKWPEQPVILEANGDSYTDANLYSAFTGFPTMAGWLVHEWLWRSYDQIAARDDEVKKIYEGKDKNEAKAILKKYNVKYVIVGDQERTKFPDLTEDQIKELAKKVFESGDVRVYQVL